MDKLVFTKIPPREGREDWNIRVDQSTYLKVLVIAKATGLPLKTVVTTMLRFALAHTEVDDEN